MIEHVFDDQVRGQVPTAVLASWMKALADLDRNISDAERIDQLRLLEDLKSGAAAAQARIAADFDASRRADQAARGVPTSQQGKDVGAQVALARRESPHRASRLLGMAKALAHEMPHTMAALSGGRLNEWRATLLVRETACLQVEDRRSVDAALCRDPATLDGLGNAKLVAEVKKLAYRLDAESVVRRARRAETEWRVTCRPAPDTMAYLTALLPARQAISVYAALAGVADTHTGTGDRRSRGQLMADTLVERATGRAAADQVPIEVGLVMTDRTLLAGDDEPALLHGYGTVPADLGRDWVDSTDRAGIAAWLRRLYTHPGSGALVAMDSRRRLLPRSLRRYVDTRDQSCRTPWCDAPIRHRDHVMAHEDGGPTTAANSQGLCEACNYAKQALGWTARPRPGPTHTVETVTPTGHRYASTAPRLPGTPGTASQDSSALARHFADIIRAA